MRSAVRWSRAVDLAGDDPRTHQQRAALAVGNGDVYVGFGGLAGDCGQYVGEVVGVPVDGAGATIAYRVPVEREGAVWATGGPVIDAAGHPYVSTGNGSSTAVYDGTTPSSSRCLALTSCRGSPRPPGPWTMSPTLTSTPRARRWSRAGGCSSSARAGPITCSGRAALGGVGGEVAPAPVCASFGATAVADATVFVPCPDGIRAVRVDAQGAIATVWQTPAADGPPSVGGGAVWSVDTGSGTLFALDAGSGADLARVALGTVPHFAAPTLAGGLVLVGTLDSLVAVRPGG